MILVSEVVVKIKTAFVGCQAFTIIGPGTHLMEQITGPLKFFAELGVTHLNVKNPAKRQSLSLNEIREELGDCTRCKLAKTRTQIVFGSGSSEADLMFVGEAPGADEDAQGLPFVGRAGQLLTRIIEAIDLSREDVYIANILKCRPPDNRNPEADEVEMCQPFLMRQIQSVGPRIIVTLGKYASQTLLATSTPISRLRGNFHPLDDVLVMPTFHPSYLLRNPGAKRDVWEDMKKVRDRLKKLGSGYYG